MTLHLLHRRLTIAMALAALAALASGVQAPRPSILVAAAALLLGLVWRPSARASTVLDRVWLIVALLLAGRAFLSFVYQSAEGVLPWIDLLLVLLASEALKPLDAENDGRLYGLSFALLVASAAYRAGVVFAGAFMGFVALSSVALMLGYLRRQAERYGVEPPRIGRRVLVVTLAASLIALTTSAFVFLSFPRLAKGWFGRQASAQQIAGLGDQVSLDAHGSEIQSNPSVALRVEFLRDAPPADYPSLHWRGRSFDHFDGVRWSSSRGLHAAVRPRSYERSWPSAEIHYDVYSTVLEQRILFALHPLLDARMRTSISPYLSPAGDMRYTGDDVPVYRATSLRYRPPAEALRQADGGPNPGGWAYLQLPDLSERVHALADSLTSPHGNRYDRVAAVESWLRTQLEYTRELPRSELRSPVDAFLFERRRGHCEYFSTAMVMLLRSAGIPARNVTGFLGGDWNEFGKYLVVTQDRAHSWVEVWFPEYGWVEFDPTPSEVTDVIGPDGALAGLRLFFDGVQHRWQKWVLDYDLGKQIELLRRASAMFERNRSRPGAAADLPWRNIALFLLAAAMTAWLVKAIRRRGAPVAGTSRVYLDLRKRYGRAGLPVPEDVTPLAFARALEQGSWPGAGPARQLISLYLESRFGVGVPPDTATEKQMRRLLRQADLELRRARRVRAGTRAASGSTSGAAAE